MVKSLDFQLAVPGSNPVATFSKKSTNLLKSEVSKNSGKKPGINSCCSTTLCEEDPECNVAALQ